MTTEAAREGAHDFDFFHGSWRVENQRLITRLAGSDEWERFPAEVICWPILGGMGNVDTFTPEWPGHAGFEGSSYRLFDPATGLWSIYWADTVLGKLFPPVLGGFANGAGEFSGDDVEGGRPVRVRYLLVRHRKRRPALGAGVLHRRWRDLGDELDHELCSQRRRRAIDMRRNTR